MLASAAERTMRGARDFLLKLGQIFDVSKIRFDNQKVSTTEFRGKLEGLNALTTSMVKGEHGLSEHLDEPRELENFTLGIKKVNVNASTLGRSGEAIQRIDLEVNDMEEQNGVHQIAVNALGEVTGVFMSGIFADQIVFDQLTSDSAGIEMVEFYKTQADRFTSVSSVDESALGSVKIPTIDFGPRIESVRYWQNEQARGNSGIDQISLAMKGWEAADEKTKGMDCTFRLIKGEGGKFQLFARPIEAAGDEDDILIEPSDMLHDHLGNELKLSAQETENGHVRLDIVFVARPEAATTYDPLRSNLFLSPVRFESVLDCTSANLTELKRALDEQTDVRARGAEFVATQESITKHDFESRPTTKQ
jgi:hypothetical protein